MGVRGSTAGVQEKGCSAIQSLAFNGESQTAIAAQGGVQAVLRAMGAHAAVAVVQIAGSGALRNLAADNPENAVAIHAKGGLEAVVRGMEAHGSSAEVQAKACEALLPLASSEALREKVWDSGVVALVQKAVGAFPGGEDLQKHGKALLKKLSA